MTPEEIVASVQTEILEILESPDSEGMSVVDLMNRAGMAGFQLGSGVTRSMFEGAFAVKVAQITK